jgi:cbb3-type cytochrome oxidase maturation protein
MNVLVYLVPLALLLGVTGLAAFLWSLRNGQYDDMDGAAVRILPDDDVEPTKLPSAARTPIVTMARAAESVDRGE